MKRTLYEEKTDAIWIRILISESKEGKVVVHGHDIGTAVGKIKAKSDYEYFLTIEEKDVKLLKDKLGLNSSEELFNWFEQEYSTDKAVSQLQEKLKEWKINSQFSSY